MWAALPTDLVEDLTDKAPLAAVAAIVGLEWRCTFRKSRACLKRAARLCHPPFNLTAEEVLGTEIAPYLGLSRWSVQACRRILTAALRDARVLLQLQSLDMSCCEPHTQLEHQTLLDFSDAISKGALPNLKNLSIQNSNIGAAGMQVLAAALRDATTLPALTGLDLGSNRLRDEGVIVLSENLTLGGLVRLNTLCLDGNQIGTQGMNALAKALQNGAVPACTTVDIHCNFEASKEAKRAIAWIMRTRRSLLD